MQSSLAPRMDGIEAMNHMAATFAVDIAPASTGMGALTSQEITAYMPLVHEEVRRILRRLPANVQKDDLVAVGSVGLMSALQKNKEADRGPQFEWYARIRIRGAVLDELRSQDWLSRGARAEVRAQAETGSGSAAVMVSFDDLPEHKRLIPTCDDESPLVLAERNSQRSALSQAVAQLPEREAKIVELHYFQGVQFKEIAALLKVSEPRISQLHARAMTMLREVLRDEEV